MGVKISYHEVLKTEGLPHLHQHISCEVHTVLVHGQLCSTGGHFLEVLS